MVLGRRVVRRALRGHALPDVFGAAAAGHLCDRARGRPARRGPAGARRCRGAAPASSRQTVRWRGGPLLRRGARIGDVAAGNRSTDVERQPAGLLICLPYPTLPYPTLSVRAACPLTCGVLLRCVCALLRQGATCACIMAVCAAGEPDAGRLPPRCTAARLTGAPGLQTHGILSDDPAANPTFHDWNHVAIWYCSSDSHLGDAPPGPAALRPARRRACCAAAAGVCLARAQPRACRRRCAPWPCADVDGWVCVAALVLYLLHSWMASYQLALRVWRAGDSRAGAIAAPGHRLHSAAGYQICPLVTCVLFGAGAARRVAGWGQQAGHARRGRRAVGRRARGRAGRGERGARVPGGARGGRQRQPRRRGRRAPAECAPPPRLPPASPASLELARGARAPCAACLLSGGQHGAPRHRGNQAAGRS